MSPDNAAPNARERDSEALLSAMDGVEVSKEDRQNGYDISLLALKPRNSAHLPDSLTFEPEDPFVDTDERSPLAHPDSSLATSDRPSSTRSSEQRAALTAVPPVSNTVPRFAAAAYQHRAQASESRSSLTKHRLDALLASEADEEKGSWVVDGVKGRRKEPLWQRKWLLLVAALVVVLVCTGVGAGVGIMMSRKKHSPAADKQDAASTSDSTSFSAAPHTATPSPAASSPTSSPFDPAVPPATAALASPTDSGSAGETPWNSSPTLVPQGAYTSAAGTEGTGTSDVWTASETNADWA
ncbi:Cell wall surface anchor family protein [Rhodotorula toruloides ATCC 204091]|uniref:Cell wall surface anchor family protein n=1 Tax=Rhodotorula toruloides TaxID=5286 RepID=A0A2S9ZYW8_RHOTO|nr:Cell wall surface anchor family protein [Rhodotorula toruloides ATCC 204091]PRQ70952.1 cell wall surface anchor family protein [Rhodotorula toruloides]